MTEKRNKNGQYEKGTVPSETNRQRSSEVNTGNTYAKKLISDELKLQVFDSYLSHLAKGKSKKSWWFDNGKVTITWQCMETYIKNEPGIFDALQIERAKSNGYQIWEQVVEDSAKGLNRDANTASLQMLMRNKFNWDKEDNVNKDTKGTLVEKFLGILDKMDDKKDSTD